MKNKKIFIACVAGAAFALMMAGAYMLSASLISKESTPVFAKATALKTAAITPKVVDGATGEPISGALIVIPGLGAGGKTTAGGTAGTIEITVSPDARFDDILPRPFGETAVLVYADGYVPCAVFGYMVAQGETRDGPRIMLYKKEDGGSNEPYLLVEPPAREWVDALVKKYQP